MNFSAFHVTRYLLWATVAILVVLGIGSFARVGENAENIPLYILYAFMMFGDAIAMLVCAVLLNRKTKWIFSLTVVVLCLNIFPTIFDQFGLVDLLFLLLNLFTLIFLISASKEFLPA